MGQRCGTCANLQILLGAKRHRCLAIYSEQFKTHDWIHTYLINMNGFTCPKYKAVGKAPQPAGRDFSKF